MSPEDRFDALVAELSVVDGVATPAGGRRFGSQAVRRHGRIVAMLSQGCLVVKLPRARVDELVAAGEGTRFDGGRGTPMKEWFVLSPGSALDWHRLGREAVDHAG